MSTPTAGSPILDSPNPGKGNSGGSTSSEPALRKYSTIKKDALNRASVSIEPTADAKQKAAELKKKIEQQYEQISATLMERDRSMLSSESLDKATAAKFYLEQQMESQKNFMEARVQRRQKLEEMLASSEMSDAEKNKLRSEMLKRETNITREKRIRLDKNDFHTIKVIGRGGFAEVRLVKKKDTSNVYAMKVLKKAEVLEWNQVTHVRAERDIMAQAAGQNEWVTNLYYAFQDPEYLYIIMEYVPGGDLMTKLVAYDTFNLETTRFYIGEILLAITSVHDMSYIHRDIKPDNILIDRQGHIKLTDFGLCTGFHDDSSIEELREKLLANKEVVSPADVKKDADVSTLDRVLNYKKKKRELAYSTVGSPNYIAPEVLLKAGYGKECDFWSAGIIMFEMLFGYPPFCSTSDNVTYWKIVRWRDYFAFPENAVVDPAAKDLIERLICDSPDRLGANGLEDFKKHDFFKNFAWDAVRNNAGPFKPDLLSETDTSYFETVHEDEWQIYENSFGGASDASSKAKDLPFVGFTFKRFHSPEISPRIPDAMMKGKK